jgi:hypothetical protein
MLFALLFNSLFFLAGAALFGLGWPDKTSFSDAKDHVQNEKDEMESGLMKWIKENPRFAPLLAVAILHTIVSLLGGTLSCFKGKHNMAMFCYGALFMLLLGIEFWVVFVIWTEKGEIQGAVGIALVLSQIIAAVGSFLKNGWASLMGFESLLGSDEANDLA